ncbi:hypothetical protein NMG60_11008535 [Bertholletia excelsa]
MPPVRPPPPLITSSCLPDIFRVSFCTAVRRAVVIGNGVAGAENQCFGLVRALGLSHRQTICRVTRPRGGVNKWLHWLPVSLHKKMANVVKHISGDSLFQTVKANKARPILAEDRGLSEIFEADAKQVAAMACETFEISPRCSTPIDLIGASCDFTEGRCR